MKLKTVLLHKNKMDANQLITEIFQYCSSNANDELAKKYSYYFKGEYNAWGLTSPQLREKVKEIVSAKSINLSVILQAAPLIMRSGKYEEISIIFLLLSNFHKHYSKETLKEIDKWYSFSIHNWAHADTLGMFVLPHFLKQSIASPAEFKSWLSSPYKFQRRCVPVSFIKLLKTYHDFTALFNIIEPLMIDHEREVHQGVGWFLREAWKVKKDETELFLLKWKNQSPRLIIQYACEKMTAIEKQRFKKVQIKQV